MSTMQPEDIVDTIVPVVEQAIARRMEEVYGELEALKQQVQESITVLDGNDHAIIAEVQRLKGSGGEQVAEVMTKAAEAWDRFVRGEAEKLGYRVLAPKATITVQPDDSVTKGAEVGE